MIKPLLRRTEAVIPRDEGDTQTYKRILREKQRDSLMNEVVMKTLTYPLLTLARAEVKGDAPVTNAFNYAHSTSRRGLCAPNYGEKKKERKEEGIAFPDFFSGSLIISPLPPAQAGIMLEHEVMQ